MYIWSASEEDYVGGVDDHSHRISVATGAVWCLRCERALCVYGLPPASSARHRLRSAPPLPSLFSVYTFIKSHDYQRASRLRGAFPPSPSLLVFSPLLCLRSRFPLFPSDFFFFLSF